MIEISVLVPAVPFNATCPWCGGRSDFGDSYDGERRGCRSCGKPVEAVLWSDDTMSLVRTGFGAGDWRTGRQRTRARWARQGRR